MSTGRSHLNVFNAASVPLMLAQALATFCGDEPDLYGLGQMLRGFTPGFVTRSGLTSQTTHVEALPGRVFAVMNTAGSTEYTIKHVGAPGAGEVLVTYSDGSGGQKGTPTLQFQAAVTGYQIEKHELPPAFDEVFDAIFA